MPERGRRTTRRWRASYRRASQCSAVHLNYTHSCYAQVHSRISSEWVHDGFSEAGLITPPTPPHGQVISRISSKRMVDGFVRRTEAELESGVGMFSHYDLNRDGVIGLDEFCMIMCALHVSCCFVLHMHVYWGLILHGRQLLSPGSALWCAHSPAHHTRPSTRPAISPPALPPARFGHMADGHRCSFFQRAATGASPIVAARALEHPW